MVESSARLQTKPVIVAGFTPTASLRLVIVTGSVAPELFVIVALNGTVPPGSGIDSESV